MGRRAPCPPPRWRPSATVARLGEQTPRPAGVKVPAPPFAVVARRARPDGEGTTVFAASLGDEHHLHRQHMRGVVTERPGPQVTEERCQTSRLLDYDHAPANRRMAMHPTVPNWEKSHKHHPFLALRIASLADHRRASEVRANGASEIRKMIFVIFRVDVWPSCYR